MKRVHSTRTPTGRGRGCWRGRGWRSRLVAVVVDHELDAAVEGTRLLVPVRPHRRRLPGPAEVETLDLRESRVAARSHRAPSPVVPVVPEVVVPLVPPIDESRCSVVVGSWIVVPVVDVTSLDVSGPLASWWEGRSLSRTSQGSNPCLRSSPRRRARTSYSHTRRRVALTLSQAILWRIRCHLSGIRSLITQSRPVCAYVRRRSRQIARDRSSESIWSSG